MKYIVLFLLTIYQYVISPFIHAATGTVHACRYPITCSEYARIQIEEKGFIKGGRLAIQRLLSCHPFAKVTPHQV